MSSSPTGVMTDFRVLQRQEPGPGLGSGRRAAFILHYHFWSISSVPDTLVSGTHTSIADTELAPLHPSSH